MLPAIARAGLITPGARKKYEEVGIPILEDRKCSTPWRAEIRSPWRPNRRFITPH